MTCADVTGARDVTDEHDVTEAYDVTEAGEGCLQAFGQLTGSQTDNDEHDCKCV